MNSQHGSRTGPIERRTWPDRLDAFALEPGSRPRLHGYDVQGDLASNYRFGEVVLTALRGSPPERAEGRAFEVALAFASGISIAEAPVHAAALANIIGAPAASVLAAGTVALAEQVRHLVEEHTRVLDEVLAGDLDRARTSLQDSDGLPRLQAAIAECEWDVPGLADVREVPTGILAVLRACGLARPWQCVSAIVIARIAPLMAEATRHRAGHFTGYPIDLPRFRYEPTDDPPANPDGPSRARSAASSGPPTPDAPAARSGPPTPDAPSRPPSAASSGPPTTNSPSRPPSAASSGPPNPDAPSRPQSAASSGPPNPDAPSRAPSAASSGPPNPDAPSRPPSAASSGPPTTDTPSRPPSAASSGPATPDAPSPARSAASSGPATAAEPEPLAAADPTPTSEPEPR